MIQILAVYSKAGATWDAAIDLVCQKRGILHYSSIDQLKQNSYIDDSFFLFELDPDCDIQIFYDRDKKTCCWGWEAKATDLHASQIGADVSFEDEIIQHLVRNQTLTRYSAIVAGPQEERDIQMFTGMCSKHGVNWNWCSTIEKAVEKCFELVENADRVIDCRKPIYINKDKKVPTRARMLAAIDGITGDRALQIYDEFKRSSEDWADFFTNVTTLIDDTTNLFRIYSDFIYNDIEPQNNRLRDPHKKQTKKTIKSE